MQIPGYLEHQAALKAAGVDEVMVFCVNDGAVMTAWQKDQGADDSLLTFYGDPSGALTKALEENKQREELNARVRSENISFENFSQFFEAEEELFPDIVASRGSGTSTPAEESQCRCAQIAMA